MLDPIIASKESGLPGNECALCKEPFGSGDLLIECPEDGAVHHTWCWRENGNHCTAAGCDGYGEIRGWADDGDESGEPDDLDEVEYEEDGYAFEDDENGEASPEDEVSAETAPPPTRVPFMLQLSQSCLVLAIAVAIIVMTFSCFGLWAILDYVALEVMGWDYRPIPQ